MDHLTTLEHELVALGAAIGCNCVSCVEHHVPAARAAGLSDAAINAAVELADAIRGVAARNALSAATDSLARPHDPDAAPNPAPNQACASIPAPGRKCC